MSVAVVAGCYRTEPVRSYTVAKEKEEEAKADAAANTAAPAAAAPQEAGDATDRMLAAIVPANGQAWFFKVVGPLAAIEQREAEINKFFETIRVGEDGRAKWDTPEGWKEDGRSGMREATLYVPADGQPLELTVSVLGWTGLLPNVNRWRGQMQLPPIEDDQLPEVTREVKADDQTITIVDLKGRYAGAGMMAPFAGGAGGARPGGEPQLPPGHPPIDTGAPDGDK